MAPKVSPDKPKRGSAKATPAAPPAAAPAPKPALSVVGGTAATGGKTPGITTMTRDERAQLRLSHVAKMRPLIAEIEKVDAQKKALNKQLTALRNTYNKDGFKLAALDEALKNEKQPRRDLAAYEQDRHELFEDLGQVIYVQPDLLAALPDEARDEQYWADAGYQAGLRGLDCKPPMECPERFTQAWIKKWHGGQEKLAWAMAPKANPERAKIGGATGPTAADIARQPEEDDEKAGDDPALV